jgi:DNA-directed RNA polymerase subunit L
MAFTNIRKDGNRLKFNIKDIDLSLVNGIRRVIIAEVPTVAFSFDPHTDKNPDVTVKTNTSSLHNEFLCHRISLIPFHFDEATVLKYEPEKYIFKLAKKNTTKDIMNVTTADIVVTDEAGKKFQKTFCESIFPKDPVTGDHILITRLQANPYNPDKGEEIDIEFKLQKGISAEHARWSPVSQCCFTNVRDPEAAAQGLKDKLLATEEWKGRKLTQDEKNMITTTFNAVDANRFYQKNARGEPNEFVFKLEVECGMRPEYLVFKGMEILCTKLGRFISGLEDEKRGDVRVDEYPGLDMFDIVVEHEDHTLLNLIQSSLHNKCIREAQTNLTYIGFSVPHPLDHKGIIKVKFNTKTSHEDLVKFMVRWCKAVKDDVKALAELWCQTSGLNKAKLAEVMEFFEDIELEEAPAPKKKVKKTRGGGDDDKDSDDETSSSTDDDEDRDDEDSDDEDDE